MRRRHGRPSLRREGIFLAVLGLTCLLIGAWLETPSERGDTSVLFFPLGTAGRYGVVVLVVGLALLGLGVYRLVGGRRGR